MSQKLRKYFRKLTISPLLNSVLISQILFGNYCGISDSTPVCFLLRGYCIVIVFSIIFFHVYNYGSNWLIVCLIFEYAFNAVFFFITGQEYIFRYYNAIRTCDTVMGFKNIPLIRWHTVVCLLIVVFHSFFTVYVGRGFAIAYIPTIILLFMTDSNRFMASIYYSSILIRVKLLRKTLEYNFVPVNIIRKDEVDKTVRSIRKGLCYYNNLMDTVRCFDTQMQCVVSVNICVFFIIFDVTYMTTNAVGTYLIVNPWFGTESLNPMSYAQWHIQILVKIKPTSKKISTKNHNRPLKNIKKMKWDYTGSTLSFQIWNFNNRIQNLFFFMKSVGKRA